MMKSELTVKDVERVLRVLKAERKREDERGTGCCVASKHGHRTYNKYEIMCGCGAVLIGEVMANEEENKNEAIIRASIKKNGTSGNNHEQGRTGENGFGYFLCGSDEVPGFAPCPFCGESDWELYEAGADWRGVAALYYWIAKCASCGTQVPGKALVFPGEDKFVEIVEAALMHLNCDNSKPGDEQ